jgi:hypothetical protein
MGPERNQRTETNASRYRVVLQRNSFPFLDGASRRGGPESHLDTLIRLKPVLPTHVPDSAFPADHLDRRLAGLLTTEADAAVRRPAGWRSSHAAMRRDGSDGYDIRPYECNTSRDRKYTCMHDPPSKSLVTNWQQIYLRASQYIQDIGHFGANVETFCTRRASAVRS